MSDLVKLHFKKPGLYTTVQDSGHIGHQMFGVPVGGAMDMRSAALANRLVGNPKDSPLLEITLLGPEIRIEGKAKIAHTGAQLSQKIDGEECKMNEVIHVEDGSLISFGTPVLGCRAYLAIAGNWCVRSWLGSVSPPMSESKILTPDSVIHKGSILSIKVNDELRRDKVSENDRPIGALLSLKSVMEVHVLPGPEYHTFENPFIASFFDTVFKIKPESNRMGYRLDPPLTTDKPMQEIISSGIVPGTIQIANSGQPLILMRDAQATGGYPRFANVVSEYFDILAQLKPGDKLKFVKL